MTTQIEKQQFRNNTEGWIGVTIIGPRGDDKGIPVEAGGTVWLSEQEQRLTANAPRRPEDNPFIERDVVRIDPTTGEEVTVKVTPLEPISEDRWVPANLRPIPGDTSPDLALRTAASAATAEEPSTVATVEAGAVRRHVEVDALGAEAQPHQPSPPPRAAQAVEAAAEAAAEALAATPPGTPLAPAAPDEASPQPEPSPAPPESVNEPQGAPVQSEETAATVDPAVGEETGAAPQPTGAAPEGEYAQAEEVGTPVPASREPEQPQPGPPAPPAPWSPGSSEG